MMQLPHVVRIGDRLPPDYGVTKFNDIIAVEIEPWDDPVGLWIWYDDNGQRRELLGYIKDYGPGLRPKPKESPHAG